MDPYPSRAVASRRFGYRADVRVLQSVTAVAVALTAATTSGCAGQSGDGAAERARHFYAAVADQDGVAACEDLAPEARAALEQAEQKPCADAVLTQDLPVRPGEGETHVFGSMAQVAYDAETAFASRYGDRWLLIAVGCPPTSGDRPHRCAIEAG